MNSSFFVRSSQLNSSYFSNRPSVARNVMNSVPQTAATTFAFSSIFIIVLWLVYMSPACVQCTLKCNSDSSSLPFVVQTAVGILLLSQIVAGLTDIYIRVYRAQWGRCDTIRALWLAVSIYCSSPPLVANALAIRFLNLSALKHLKIDLHQNLPV